jgi:cobyrinic acid a,c-diamide synthase
MVSAPASGQGKTSVTAAIARHHVRRGRRVAVFKTGPDFLDPMLLEAASGQPVRQLDLYMGGLDHCRALLFDAAQTADLILVEGVMGLFDGTPSSADLAQAFGLPVLAVIDASAMAQTFGALAHGLATYRSDIRVAGVVANRVGSAAHAAMVAESLPPGLPLWAALPRDTTLSLPERHLGLVQAMEQPGLPAQLDRWANAWSAACGDHDLPPPVSFAPAAHAPIAPLLQGRRIAIARDEALSFIYPANLDVLRALGAELVFFSPLRDAALPACDAVWLPGGYPELHLDALAANTSLWAHLRAHHGSGKPLLAECGGLLCLVDSLADVAGQPAPMAGILPGHAAMQKRLTALGLHEAALPEGTLRGHTFHYSQLDTPLSPLLRTTPQRAGRGGEAVYRVGRLTASYFHAYFPSNPAAMAALLGP